MRERRSAATLLTEVTSRLNDVAAFIASGDSDRHASREAGESLNTKVMSDVRQLSDEAKSATDLGPLRQLIAARVDSISSQVRVFRDREEARYRAHTERTAKLSQQVKDLTSKSASLESDLEKERQFARIDALTGVANRAAFDERLREEIARLRRGGAPVSLLCWDLDHFKSINDQFGHVVGDRVLREVAACFVGRMRSTDFIARLGGEEFVTLLIGTAAAGALKVADDLRQAVADLRMHCRGTPVTVTVSCGITQLLGDDASETALERADVALYRAKDSGRNTCIAA
jgi:diguanylate cyclase